MTIKVKGPMLSDSQIKEINKIKEAETRVLNFIDALKNSKELSVDPRWIATGKTDIEKGFMSLTKSIASGSTKTDGN